MITTTQTTPLSSTDHQRHLRAVIQRLVIDLGYLEHCLAAGSQDTNRRTAASGIDTAIDCLTARLS